MKPQLERELQNDILAALGSEPDLLILRNSVGMAQHIDPDTGRSFRVPYGLGVGSPDLVGLLRVHLSTSATVSRDFALWFALELKTATGRVSPEQERSHRIWRQFGAFVYVVRSVDQAKDALARARRLEC